MGGSVQPNFMPVGPYANQRYSLDNQVTEIERENDQSTDLEKGLLQAHQNFAHISVPDDGSGTRSRKGSFDPASLAQMPVSGLG